MCFDREGRTRLAGPERRPQGRQPKPVCVAVTPTQPDAARRRRVQVHEIRREAPYPRVAPLSTRQHSLFWGCKLHDTSKLQFTTLRRPPEAAPHGCRA